MLVAGSCLDRLTRAWLMSHPSCCHRGAWSPGLGLPPACPAPLLGAAGWALAERPCPAALVGTPCAPCPGDAAGHHCSWQSWCCYLRLGTNAGRHLNAAGVHSSSQNLRGALCLHSICLWLNTRLLELGVGLRSHKLAKLHLVQRL